MWKLTFEQKQAAAARYAAGENASLLGPEFGVSNVAILGIARRRGITIRTNSASHRRLALNESAFSTVTENSAYWAGFLMADGCVFRRALSLSLCEVDEPHVHKFKSFLGSAHQIVRVAATDRSRAQARLEVKSDTIIADLAKYGVTANKTHTASVQLLSLDRHFWRGVIDGDGWVGQSKNGYARAQLVGSAPLLQQFVTFVQKVCPECTATVRPHRTIYSVGLSGQSAVSVVQALYHGVSVALERKLNAALNILAGAERRPLAEEILVL